MLKIRNQYNSSCLLHEQILLTRKIFFHFYSILKFATVFVDVPLNGKKMALL